jgi:hypothetical protein
MWTCVHVKTNKTTKKSGSNKIIFLFTSHLFYCPAFCSYQLLSAGTAVPLNLVTMQSHPHTLEIQNFCLVIEMFMDFRKFGFLEYTLDNFTFARIKLKEVCCVKHS